MPGQGTKIPHVMWYGQKIIITTIKDKTTQKATFKTIKKKKKQKAELKKHESKYS